jgi:hypothetical protein
VPEKAYHERVSRAWGGSCLFKGGTFLVEQLCIVDRGSIGSANISLAW